MTERNELEAMFVANLPVIEQIIGLLCHRHGVGGADAEDCGSWIKQRFIENEYAAFREFRGESSLRTYLTVVVTRLSRDYRIHKWGRWRASAAALRRGSLAVKLETLVHRDGLRVEQAGEILRTSGATQLSDRELSALLRALPTREPLRPREVGVEPLMETATADRADQGVERAELVQERSAADTHLRRALEHLSHEDQVILRLHFWEGLGIAHIARALGLPQKPLYRRLDRYLANLKGQLEAAGISRDTVQALLGEIQ